MDVFVDLGLRNITSMLNNISSNSLGWPLVAHGVATSAAVLWPGCWPGNELQFPRQMAHSSGGPAQLQTTAAPPPPRYIVKHCTFINTIHRQQNFVFVAFNWETFLQTQTYLHTDYSFLHGKWVVGGWALTDRELDTEFSPYQKKNN